MELPPPGEWELEEDGATEELPPAIVTPFATAPH
jgi:hypothetical protein